MASSKVSPLPFNVPIADPETGNPSPFFARQLRQLLDEAIATAVATAAAQAAADAAQATADNAVPQTRLINTTSPIAGGGALTSDLTLTHAASGVTAASYTNANITVDAKGHVTVAANGSAGGTGSVTSVSVTTANGVSGSVANPTTTPAITLTLGAITPTSVNASGTVLGSNLSGTHSGASSGTNTGDQTTVSGNAGSATILQTARNFSITGGGITASAVSFDGSAVVTLNASVDAGHITLARMANLAASSFIGNNTGSPATPLALTVAQAKTLLAISAADVSGLGYFATGTDAANLTGTVAAARLPALTGDVTTVAGTVATTLKSWPAYASGRYYVPGGINTFAAGTANVVGTTYLTPGTLFHAVTIQSLVARISTLGAGNCQYALYAASATTGDPTGAPFYTSASTSTGTQALLEIATTQTVGPGLIWFGLQVDNTTVIFLAKASSDAGMSQISGEVTTATFLAQNNPVALSKTGSFGTWPTLTGNRTTDSLGESTSKSIAWGFKVQ